MNATAIAAIGAIAFGLIAILALLPAATAIPARLDAQWSRDVQAHLQRSDENQNTNYSYSIKQKVLLVAVAAAVGYGVVWKYGAATQGLAFGFYFIGLTLIVAINLKHYLLPDVVVLSILWAGLLFQAFSGNASASIYGALVGYLVPFLIGLAFKMKTRAEVIGQGDCKTLSMAGAWFGVESMPIVFGAFVVGLILWVILTKLAGPKSQRYIATGAAHLVASLVAAFGTTTF